MAGASDEPSPLVDLATELRQQLLYSLVEDANKSATRRFKDPCKIVEQWCTGQMFGKRASREDCSPTDSGFWQRIVKLVFDPVLMRDRLSPVWTHLPQKRLATRTRVTKRN